MNNIMWSFTISVLAGLSTLIGALVVFFNKKKDIITECLAFAAGVMITVSFSDLIPSSYYILINNYHLILTSSIIFLFIMIGFLLSTYFDEIITKKVGENKMLKVGIMSLIAIILHNIPEGIATFLTSNNNITLGITLALAIGLHNIPEGISIALPIFYATGSRGKALLYASIAGLSEIIGSILAYTLLQSIINDLIMGIIYAIIAGIMINISAKELLPTAYNKNKITTLKYFIIGSILMLVVHIIIK